MTRAEQLLDALEQVDDRYLLQAREHHCGSTVSIKKRRRLVILAAAAVLLLALCGFAAYETGFHDLWRQTPAADPTETVRSAIEGQAGKDYTLSVTVEEVYLDEAETARVAALWRGSELAEGRNWTEEDFDGRFAAVYARYETAYDHTKTPLDDGETEQWFYLMQDAATGEWSIVDNSTPSTS